MGTKPWQNSEGYSDPTASGRCFFHCHNGLPPVVAAEVGVVDFQSPVERPNTPDFPLLKINFQENDPAKILQG